MAVHAKSWGRCAAVLLALVACKTTPEPDPAPARVAEVRYEGLDTLDRDDLRPFLLTDRRGRWPWSPRPLFDRLSVEEDARLIENVYETRGFFETRVEHETQEADDGTVVIFRVQEGPPVLLREVSIEWTDPPPEGVTDVELPFREGERFELEHYRDAKQILITALANHGRPRAAIDGGADVDLAAHRASVRWSISPGPAVRFGAMRVTGEEEVNPDLISREAANLQGEPFSREALLAAQRRVFALGLFEAVQVRARRDPNAPPGEAEAEGIEVWPVTVSVTEREPRTIEAGLGYGTEERVRTKLSWTHRNAFGGAQRLYLQARYSSLNEGVEAKLTEPRFFEPDVSLGLNGSLLRETRPTYDADRARASVELARNLSDTLSGRTGWSLEWNDVTGVSAATEAVVEDAEDSFLLSQVFARLDRDATDFLLDPTSGSRQRAEIALSPVALGSDFNFVKAELETRVYRSVKSLVFAARLEAGVIQPFSGTSSDEVPLVSRFFSGGSNSVRGYPFQELGPLDAGDEPLGGTTRVEGNLEMRFPIWQQVRGVVFADAGQVALDAFTFHPDDLFFSVGFGLRAGTPVGPLRIDVGHPLNPNESVDRLRLHLSIGHAF